MAVLFIHESGHWLGMKVFGYRDLKMFFIPFFGAAVTGKQRKAASGAAGAVIALLGPAPGRSSSEMIAAVATPRYGISRCSCGSMRRFLGEHQPFSTCCWHFFRWMAGVFLEAVLFSRHAALEVVFKVLAALGLALIALGLHSILLGFLALITTATSREAYFCGKIARGWRKRWGNEPIPDEERMPREQLESLVPELGLGLGAANTKAKTRLAQYPGMERVAKGAHETVRRMDVARAAGVLCDRYSHRGVRAPRCGTLPSQGRGRAAPWK